MKVVIIKCGYWSEVSFSTLTSFVKKKKKKEGICVTLNML